MATPLPNATPTTPPAEPLGSFPGGLLDLMSLHLAGSNPLAGFNPITDWPPMPVMIAYAGLAAIQTSLILWYAGYVLVGVPHPGAWAAAAFTLTFAGITFVGGGVLLYVAGVEAGIIEGGTR